MVTKQVVETKLVTASNPTAALVELNDWMTALEKANEGFYLISSYIKPQSKESTYKLIVRYGCEVSEG